MPSKRKRYTDYPPPLPLIDLANSNSTEPDMKRSRRYSSACERPMPEILNTSTEFGSPHKFWTSLCEKDEAYFRDPNYMDKYRNLKPDMRCVLFGWLMDVCDDMTLHRETYHLAIDFFDRLCSKGGIDVKPQNLQLIGISSLWLAAKMEEIYPPKVSELVALTESACTEDETRRMEEIILSKLEWHCSPVTAVQWLAFYLHLISKQELEPFNHVQSSSSDSLPSNIGDSVSTTRAPISCVSISSDSQYVSQENDLSQMTVDINASLDQSFILSNHSKVRHLGQLSIPKLLRDDFIVLIRVIELCIFDMEYLNFTYSQVAAAVVMLFYEPRDQVEAITGFKYRDLIDVIKFVSPAVRVVRADVKPGVIMPEFHHVHPRDIHNIQTGCANKEDNTGYRVDYNKLRLQVQHLKERM